ncbi:conserved Plasmodium protein, unknown function [Plasmodium knowlesi strain H]|uniref:Dynein regulatory complex protein 10 n=3 Tax=Plasmodium knowlesi TaxID=5850 RepID=A0A5K1U284_PLAKH|nr:conserved Plasmodium protein, unknown function [Plasmodium knowlesi strain H]OTN68506.1 Uncharacterized protein PKNOH_S02312300 [Plasmodium knowlesi]CAA9986624.1 conserved Plasmodium protein, unknown function [Plasmodium knowlesi strain H]SBO24096.1 conserved Plasmodium protein, unknown function [Plasmodium knowlesi strain H]SBO29335.1 conserved Plasmodium protein, unknown function [Plasmodium knowlesi strain H]VVS76098.1 conserved Plasmodium protein, unknown function [Plasmodium knowlesi s|eukprot:XP_002261164.1 hypothetical protein, conserved in Plasmodium species [Plasmodium knowlesi strain H]
MQRLYSKNLTEENIDEFIESEKAINIKLTRENEEIKEKNGQIQKRLLAFIQDNFIFESDSTDDVHKYNSVLLSLIDYMDRLKMVESYMRKETDELLGEFFRCIKEAIVKQSNLCYLIREDMNQLKINGKEEAFRKYVLALRMLYEHNSVLRAQVSLFNTFKLKDENLIHVDFEQLQLRYKHLKSKGDCLEKKIENLNKKIKRSTEKKLHYDEKNLYLEKILEDKQVVLDESQSSICNKKKLVNELKRKKDESIKKYSEVETSVITKNVFEEFQEKKIHLDRLKEKLEEVKEKYERLQKGDEAQ